MKVRALMFQDFSSISWETLEAIRRDPSTQGTTKTRNVVEVSFERHRGNEVKTLSVRPSTNFNSRTTTARETQLKCKRNFSNDTKISRTGRSLLKCTVVRLRSASSVSIRNYNY